MAENDRPRDSTHPERQEIRADGGDAAQYDSLAETLEHSLPEAIAPIRHEVTRPPDELFPLWRQRLRLAAALMLAGFVLYLGQRGLQLVIGYPIGSAADWFLLWSQLAVAGILGLFNLLLFSRQPSSYFRLIVAELALFGLPAGVFLASQYFLTLRACEEWGVFAFSGAPWMLLIFVYALFMPSTLRRAALVIGSLAAAPVLLVLGMAIVEPAVARVLTLDVVAGVLLGFVLAAVGGVIGVSKIGSLRREALRAKRLGQYRLTKRLGRGGMGEVFLAEHEMLKRPCVIKLIRPDKVSDEKTLARFQREVQATARLSHWNTVEILDYGRTEDGTFFYVMEYLPGMTLGELTRRHGPLPSERVIYLLLQVCDALREAHHTGLVHRDVKPENIVVAQRGGVYDVAKVLDFGLVEPIADGRARRPTAQAAITGSPLFMSPEQAAGSVVADPRIDVYSLGAVAYYTLTGRPPFSRGTLVELVEAHRHEEPAPPSQLNPAVADDLERVVLKCLAKDPAERFADMPRLADALSRCEVAEGWSRDRAARWWNGREPQQGQHETDLDRSPSLL